MASTIDAGENHLNPLPQHSPEFSNLEIRGTWSGDELDPVNLRLSLEVQCVPNTELQLLNTRSTSISLVKAFSVRLQSDGLGQENHSSESSPQSPLFAFSAPVSDDGAKGPSTFPVGISAKGLSTAGKESSTGLSKETTPTTENSMRLSDSLELGSLSLSFSPPRFSSGMHLNVARCADWIRTQNLGKKRSASDACLTDSSSDSEKNKTPSRKPSAKSAVSKYSSAAESTPESDDGSVRTPCKTTDRGAISILDQSPPRAFCERHSRKHSMIPKRVSRLQNDPAKQASSSPTFGPTSNILDDKQLSENGDFPTPTKPIKIQPPHDKGEGHGSFSTTTTATTSNPSQAVESVATELTNITKSNSDRDSSQSSLGLKTLLDSHLIDLEPDEQPTTSAIKPTTPEPSSPPPREDVIAPQTPVSKGDATTWVPGSGHKHRPSCDCDDCQPGMSKPQVEIDGGIIFIRNPAKVRPATYKVAVTLSVFLENGNPNGWNDLVIPGLPRMRAGENAFFVFLMPENHGLEFRTTNLQRYKTVENCFCAEFVNQRDLIVPLRVCDQRFYGIVKDFTVDQEIRAEHTVVANIEGPGKAPRPDIVVKYTAMCSLRLHNRFFWAEKCCFFLRLDGGPEGCFRCQLKSQKTDLQMIQLQARDDAIGVSHIQVICSPRDLEMFGITWEVNLRGRQAMNWLPRIYPVSSTSCESNKNNLRQIFTELEAGLRRKIGHEPVRLTDVDDGNDNAFEAEHSTEKQSAEDDDRCPEQPSELPFEEQDSPVEMGHPSLRTSITDSRVELLTYWKQYLITTFCVSVIWCIISVTLYTPTYSNAFNGALNETGLNVPPPIAPVDLNSFGASPSHGGTGPELTPSKRDVITEQATESQSPESFEQGSKTNTAQNGNHPAAEDIQEASELVGTSVKGSGSISKVPGDQSVLSLRDRIDYWLGWRGPIPDEL
ncbi:uncharacterized protein ACLA_050020 [Aspergillus clavatus NRRL 1]|uniref:Uncharacterized protein n=1 Tax=Aspergillus clavatus (strain ATCC 1007 / CBS 513.65 / DSM 816 / NCTC 3887 / NRRL 1 / QM 1276 / 107) TaxID=344612 RepID=A1CI25_ASPCL|nr:uncharacterized protein ACLA_050020 [Aspergillus clavatus NRRL 1]EAW10530.1 conserved hypothetical protein [Aspergillus clavatus NRRL 1]